MATFFGEVVVAPSRAGVDDEEEAREETPEDREIRRELEKKREIDILWTLKSGATTESCADEPFVCSKFIVAIGRNAAAFLSSFILDSVCWEVVGVVKLWNEWCRTSSTTNVLPTDSFCLFYRLISDPTVLLCQCSCYVAEDQQFQWLEKVFGCMRKEGLQVTILSTCPVADYKTQESTLTLPSPFLKALKTKEFKEQICCPLLEQPNIVRDLPAAVLSYCQVWQIPAVLYQCYTDVIKLDTVTIEAFKPLLSSKILKSLVKVTPSSAEECCLPNQGHSLFSSLICFIMLQNVFGLILLRDSRSNLSLPRLQPSWRQVPLSFTLQTVLCCQHLSRITSLTTCDFTNSMPKSCMKTSRKSRRQNLGNSSWQFALQTLIQSPLNA